MDFMGCMNCGLRSMLNMIPLRWNDDGDVVGFVLMCDKCIDEGTTISWAVDDGRDSKEETEQAG